MYVEDGKDNKTEAPEEAQRPAACLGADLTRNNALWNAAGFGYIHNIVNRWALVRRRSMDSSLLKAIDHITRYAELGT